MAHTPGTTVSDDSEPDVEGCYRVLVVDDETDLEHLMRQRLRRDVRAGRFELVFAHDGVEALEILQTQDIDMVLSDINMPRMDGLTLLQQIPKVDPDIRSVIVSAYGDMQNIRTAMNRGAFDFVTKPIDFADLKTTLNKTRRHVAALREALATRDRLVAVENELALAREMQQSILPREFPEHPGYEIFGNMEAARAVGGDFFNVITLGGDKVGLAIADVSGKGPAAALFMMASHTTLKGAAIGHADPGRALTEANDLIESDNRTTNFVTVFYGVYDPANGTLTYANGGHNPPLIVHPDGSSTVLGMTGGIALGIAADMPFDQSEVTLDVGDTVVLYTDGVTEAMNTEDEEFELSRLQAVYQENAPQSAKEANDLAFEAVRAFAEGAPQSDDITCLALRRI